MIRRCELQRGLDLVHRSGVHTDLETLLRPTGAGGRPRRLRVDVFPAALLSTVAKKLNLCLTNVHEVLTTDLARSSQVQLGVREHGQLLTIRQVRYLLEAIEKKLAYTHSRVPDLSDADRAERHAALQNIMDKLLAATIPAHLAPARPVRRRRQRDQVRRPRRTPPPRPHHRPHRRRDRGCRARRR